MWGKSLLDEKPPGSTEFVVESLKCSGIKNSCLGETMHGRKILAGWKTSRLRIWRFPDEKLLLGRNDPWEENHCWIKNLQVENLKLMGWKTPAWEKWSVVGNLCWMKNLQVENLKLLGWKTPAWEKWSVGGKSLLDKNLQVENLKLSGMKNFCLGETICGRNF